VEARRALDAFVVLNDGVGMAEAAIALDNLAFVRGRIAEAQLWASEALRHALDAGRPREATQGAGDLLGFAIVGPLPFDEFPAAARGLPSRGKPLSDSVSHALMAVAALAGGDDGGFQEHQGRWRDLLDRHGLAWLAAAQALEIAVVEMSVGKAEAAERRLREAREFFVSIGNLWYISIADEFLCEAVGAQDRPREFLRLADAFAATVLVADRENLIKRQLVLARAHLLRGSCAEAEIAARRGLELAEQTDLVLDHADALLVLADVLDALDRGDDAAIARGEALMKLRAKGNLAAVARLTGQGGQRSPSF
jgi:hypothetical protein